ncbi:hypothetical protein DPPLL_07570 [Desulfofustis limnaeus]|uniref:Uncharacterized protein n=1 Tax=Desulfofustis limnaeus TaxID=2740163 RepID=A0ABM7W643_9BACT|nr:hypothetical protein DPPLL_07570 [Desulfofustis limnaeus]
MVVIVFAASQIADQNRVRVSVYGDDFVLGMNLDIHLLPEGFRSPGNELFGRVNQTGDEIGNSSERKGRIRPFFEYGDIEIGSQPPGL